MLKLILLRHAKSSWKHAGLGDHDRPLKKRGRASSTVMARWLSDNDHLPDIVLCSSSIRTQETYALMRATVPVLPEPDVRPDLYHASAKVMLDMVRAQPGQSRSVMLVGHQPGMGALTARLAPQGAPAECQQAIAHFPTAAAVVFTLPGKDWSGWGTAPAGFVAFAVPRDLMSKGLTPGPCR